MADRLDKNPPSPLDLVLRSSRRALVAPISFSFVLNVLGLTVPIYMMQVFDRVLASRSLDTLLFLTLITLSALILLGAIDWLRARIMVRVGVWIDRVLSPQAFGRALDAQIQGQPYRMEALSDVAQVRSFLSGTALFALFDAPWAPIYMLVIFLLHPWLGAIAVVGTVVLLGLALVNDLTTRPQLRQAGSAQIRNMQEAESAVRNAEVIDAMGMLGPILHRWNAASSRALDDQQLASDRANAIVSVSKFVRLSLQMAVLGIGAYLVMGQRLTPGGMIAGSILLSRALQPVEQAIATWRQLISARQAYLRLGGLFRGPSARRQSLALPAPAGRLAVERVVYVFPGAQRPTLKGLTFSIEPGEGLAIIGPSASGKTTLARALVGVIRPNSGAVRLDGADVFSWHRADFGKHVGYLPQDVELFAGTVCQNIARFSDRSPEEAVEAAQMAGCHEMILRLPQGYDSEIGEAGSHLSGGQRQRIALARALFGKPQLVVLDEPNANLDAEGEVCLVRALSHLKRRGATVLVISHKGGIVQVMDRVVVLRDGVIADLGDRDEVLARIARPAERSQSAFPRVVDGGKSD